VSNPAHEVGNFFSGLDDAVHSAVDSIGSTVQNIINNPLPMIETIALTAMGVPYPIASAAVTAANGGSIEQIAISAGAAYVGGQIGAQVGAASEFGTMPFSEQTSMLLADSGGMATTMQTIVSSASGSAAAAALSGKPLDQILTAGFTGGINTIVTDQLISAGYNPKDIDTKVIANAVSSASSAILQGKDVGDAITRSTVASLSSAGMQEAANKIGTTYDQIKQNSETLQGISNSFNETKATAQEVWNNLTSYESTAKEQAGQADGLLSQFNEKRGQIDGLKGQYEQAKADSKDVDAYLVRTQPDQYRMREFDDDGTHYKFLEQFIGYSDDGPYYQRVGPGEDSPDPRDAVKNNLEQQAKDISNQIIQVNADATNIANQFYSTKAAYEDTVTNKLNPTKATYDGHVKELVRLGDLATQVSNETNKLGTTLGTLAGEYTVKQNELAVNLATEVAKTAGQDITTQLDTKKAEDAETARVAKEEDDARTKQLADALANPPDTSQNPVSPVTAAITGTVSLNNDTIDESTGLSTVSVPKIQDAGGGFKYNEATGKYIDPTGKEITAEEYDRIKNPSELDPLLVDVAPEPLPKTDEDTTSPLSTLDTTATDTTNPDAKVDTEKTDTTSPLSTLDTEKTDTTSPLSTLDTEKTDTTGPLSTLDTEKTDTTGPNLTGGSGDPGYDTYLALNPGNPLSLAPWKWQSQEPELGDSDEWRQKYKDWQAQNPDLKAGTLDVLGEQDPSFDPWDNPEEDVTEEEPKEDPTKEDPTKLPSTKIPVPTTTTTVPKITLPATTTKTTTTIPAATTAAPSSAAPAASTDATGGIPNLTPGLTKAMNDYQLTGLNAIDTTPEMAGGGSTSGIEDLNSGKDYNPMATSSISYLKPGLTRANLQYALTGMPAPKMHKADGGEIMQEDLSMPEGHHPEFFSEGGLHNRYVRGDGDGTSDDVPAMLANGEWVIPADVVSALGNGSNDAGAKVLDEFMKIIRQHKQDHEPHKLPPDSKGPLSYLKEAYKNENV